MFRTHPLEAALSWIVTPQRDQEDRLDAGTFYIDLGDQFDDGRRLGRAGCGGNVDRSGAISVSDPACAGLRPLMSQ